MIRLRRADLSQSLSHYWGFISYSQTDKERAD